MPADGRHPRPVLLQRMTGHVKSQYLFFARQPLRFRPLRNIRQFVRRGGSRRAFAAEQAVLAALGMRGPPARRAAVLAVAAALTWALEATFLKTATGTLATSGIGGMLTDWPVYAFIAATVAGTLLQQAALHVGPLSVSQPFLVITDPFASIILSVWLFDERFTDSPAKITVAVLAFAVMAVGVTMLTRTAPKDLTPS